MARNKTKLSQDVPDQIIQFIEDTLVKCKDNGITFRLENKRQIKLTEENYSNGNC